MATECNTSNNEENIEVILEKYNILKSKCYFLEHEQNAIMTERDRIYKENQDLREKNYTLELDVAIFKDMKSTLEKEKETEKHNFEKKQEQLQQKLDHLEKERNEAKSYIDYLKEKNSVVEANIYTLWNKDRDVFMKQVSDVNDVLEKERVTYQKQLDTFEKERCVLQKNYDILKYDYDTLKSEFENLTIKFDNTSEKKENNNTIKI